MIESVPVVGDREALNQTTAVCYFTVSLIRLDPP
jgi:hypothetical protein